ncbi:hypothetical protein PGC34_23360 [Pseudomonas kribbensis]|uniref:hypothetical protein n=1 Tax=Pseudomonas kribbensis TaxID=1628086 RepID=UPI003BF8733E
MDAEGRRIGSEYGSLFDPVTGFFLVMLLADICVFGGWFFPLVSLSENQVLYIYSSQAQVVAAVYGLTITGYIFRSNQYDRLQDKDESLKEVLDKIKIRQHSTISFITVLSLLSIFCALVVIVFRESEDGFVRVLTQNLSAALFVGVLVFVGVFVREAMLPDQIERASNDLKREVEADRTTPEFSGAQESSQADSIKPENVREERASVQSPEVDTFALFMTEFNEVEKILDRYASAFLGRQGLNVSAPLSFNKAKSYRRFLSKQAIVREMIMGERVSKIFADDLLKLIKYRNALVHGSDFNVPFLLLKEVFEAREKLYKLLDDELKEREFGPESVGLSMVIEPPSDGFVIP